MSLKGTSSHGLLSFLNNTVSSSDFDAIKIMLASAEKIRSWSYGEVTKTETINYRTLKPERDGLFCARIFGTIKDYECLCGKYKRIKYKGIVCEKCGVEVTSSKVRRERMGHIELAAPVSHIWFLKSLPSRISTLLGMALKDVERILYFEAYVVLDGMMSPLNYGEILTEDEYAHYRSEYGSESFVAGIGAEAVQKMLVSIDLQGQQLELREALNTTTSDIKREKIVKRLRLIEDFINSGNKPEWMILTSLPVIPPDIRPLVMLDGGRFATSDLNELYRRVINRNNRLKRLLELNAPGIIIRNEKRMLQEAVDSLLDNGRNGNIAKNNNQKPFKSLSDMLKGKQGRFRQNLLGKRVDYSGRSVIVVGPELKLHQCGLPKKMALELFKPFIYSKLELYGLSTSIKISKKMVEMERPEVWDALEEVIREHPVLLNRAPTLHRLGIQAFEPILIEGKAIQLHPLVCVAFNADFDGDQMAVHIPLSIEAQVEARVLMMSTNNILSPSSGKPIIAPSQDIILGVYYVTLENNSLTESQGNFGNFTEVEYGLATGTLHVHDAINYRYSSAENKTEWVKTTVGRAMLHNILPKAAKSQFALINKVMTKKEITALIDAVYRMTGPKETVIFCDHLMLLGFKNACHAGISIGKDDIVIPSSKGEHIEKTMKEVKSFERQYMDGFITNRERYNKIIDAWSSCTDIVSKDMMAGIAKRGDVSSMNSIFMMADSGARGSETQIKQLAGMRGLMAKPSGEIIETPIISNFKEGLDVLEYFNSAHGARKGLADTALKTANSGYLTRRLVDVAQDMIITEYDCGTSDGITAEPTIEDGKIVIPLVDKILGRVAAQDVVDPDNGKVIVKAAELFTEALCEKIATSNIRSILMRSVLTCATHQGVCAKCYGRDLATGDLVSRGEAVGVIAAQSIGEPGTQLTMRTFHIGGAAMRGAEQSYVISPIDGIIKIVAGEYATNSIGNNVVIGRNMELSITENGQEKYRYQLTSGSRLNFINGSQVKKGDKVAEWDPYNIVIVAEKSGKVAYKDLVADISIREQIDEMTSSSAKVVIDWKQNSSKKSSSLKPALAILGDTMTEVIDNVPKKKGAEKKSDTKLEPIVLATYFLSVGASIYINDQQDVKAGDILVKVPKESSKNRDITGGLPRVAELFEARRPKNHSIISEIDGIVEFGKDYKVKRRIIVHPSDKSLQAVEYMIPKGKHIFVSDGDFIRRGDLLMDGNAVPHDILKILGVEALTRYMVGEIQKVYRLQGVKIDDKHIEVIVRQMLRKVEITDGGDTGLLAGNNIDHDDFEAINQKVEKEGLRQARGSYVLLGITKASLQTKSFISAASFQETTKVLTEAALQGKVDTLQGLKENVIVGRLIPAGTGFVMNELRKQAISERKIREAEAYAAQKAVDLIEDATIAEVS